MCWPSIVLHDLIAENEWESTELLNFKINKFYDRLLQKNSISPHLSYFNKSNLTKLFSKNGFISKNAVIDSICNVLKNFRFLKEKYY